MKTANDIISYIFDDWLNYVCNIVERRGITAALSELTDVERTALEMYRIAANCFT